MQQTLEAMSGCESDHTSDAMSSSPRHCLSFSCCRRLHISGSSSARLSCPVHPPALLRPRLHSSALACPSRPKHPEALRRRGCMGSWMNTSFQSTTKCAQQQFSLSLEFKCKKICKSCLGRPCRNGALFLTTYCSI